MNVKDEKLHVGENAAASIAVSVLVHIVNETKYIIN